MTKSPGPLPVDLFVNHNRYRSFIGTFHPETCPSCDGPLDLALVGLEEELLVCPECGYEQGDEVFTESDFGNYEENRHGK